MEDLSPPPKRNFDVAVSEATTEPSAAAAAVHLTDSSSAKDGLTEASHCQQTLTSDDASSDDDELAVRETMTAQWRSLLLFKNEVRCRGAM